MNNPDPSTESQVASSLQAVVRAAELPNALDRELERGAGVGGVFDVIYADPPWRYGMRKWGKETVMGSRGENTWCNYDTMTMDDMKAMPVRSIGAETSLCFMWATFPCLADALALMSAWGYEYKTAAFVWVKTALAAQPDQMVMLPQDALQMFWGMGAYTRANAEVVLLGTRGENTKLVARHDVHSVIFAPVGGHSEKPHEARRRIEQLCGDVRRIELFARDRAQGWSAWGNEVSSGPLGGGGRGVSVAPIGTTDSGSNVLLSDRDGGRPDAR